MISSTNFRAAINVLDKFTSSDSVADPLIQFEKEYVHLTPLVAAIKIIHKALLEGSDKQQEELLSLRDKIIVLNERLANGSKISPEVEGMQIALPQTKIEKMLEIATRIPRIIFTVFVDLLLLPFALGLVLAACCQINFNPNPEDVKKGKIPILLLHGSDFNETEWIVGRQFLKQDQYGSVFSLNYDGLISNDPKKGIDDYAKGKISDKVKEIKKLTGSDQVILIGHSMGGLIAGYYAEYVAQVDEVKVENVISIATPWQGTPVLDVLCKIGDCFSKGSSPKRHLQMSVERNPEDDPNFRKNLVAKALNSEREGVRKYYNIYSTTDYAVPGQQGNLTEDPRRQRSFNYLGHYALVVWPTVWLQTCSWLDEAYASTTETNKKPLSLEGNPILI